MSRLESSAKPLIKSILLGDSSEEIGRNEDILSRWCILKACSFAYALVQENPCVANWPTEELLPLLTSIAPKELSAGDIPENFTVAVALLTDGELWGKHNLFHAIMLPGPTLWIAFMGVIGKLCFWVVNNDYGQRIIEFSEEQFFPSIRILGRNSDTPLVKISRENARALFVALRPIVDGAEIYEA